MQRVRVREPVLLRQQDGVLPLGGLQPLDLGHAAPQVFRFLSALPGQPGQLRQLTADLAMPLVGPLVVAEHGGQFRAGEPVQRLALPGRPEQLLLVRLPVHGDQVVGHVSEERHRHGAAARVGP